ncbi:MAG TPA: tetratricopeptide repeat protein [Capsulimonadaceae bacterium]|nr:tetratricopeptide repeat protein [Capsulimonadaceae bacterium]
MAKSRPQTPRSFFQLSGPTKSLGALVIVLLPVAAYIASGPWRAERALARASLPELQARVRQDPNDFTAQYYLARRERAAGQYQLALQSYQRAAALDPSDEKAWVELGQTAAEMGQLPWAISILEGFCQKNPQSAAGHAELSILYSQANSFQQAADEAGQAAQLDPNLPDAWIAQGKADQAVFYKDQAQQAASDASAQAAKAQQAFQQAIKLAPSDRRGYAGLGVLQDDQIQYGPAIASLRKAVALGATDPVVFARLGSALLLAGKSPADLSDAVTYLQRALAHEETLSPGTRQHSYLYLAQAYQEQDRWRDALPWLKKAAAMAPNDPDVHYNLARTYQMLGDSRDAARETKLHETLSEQAIARQRLADHIAITPQDDKARLTLARMYVAGGDDASAARQYQVLLQRDPKNTVVRQDWAALLRKHQEHR